MIIKNGLVFTDRGRFECKDLYVEDGRFVATKAEVSDQTEVDATGCKVIPGMVDVHSHGAAGYDFGDATPEGLEAILTYERAHGITSYCPTSMTVSKEELCTIFSTIFQIDQNKKLAKIAGIHMEGPFIAPAKKGAQNEIHIKPADKAFFEECQEAAGGMIKVITMAPEEGANMEFVREMKDQVHISLGHTCTNYQTAKEAFAAGADHVTHCFNAMQPLNHREPGLVGAAMEDDHAMIEIICDGVHIHPAMIKMMFDHVGPERMVLISDSLSATGVADGMYEFGGQPFIVKDGKGTLLDGTIAGSTTNLFECMKKAMEFGVPEEWAILAATRNPAQSIGVYDEVGSIAPGKAADFLIVSENYELKEVFVDGVN